MSFLIRLATRAAPGRRGAPLLMPKDHALSRTPIIARMEESEEEPEDIAASRAARGPMTRRQQSPESDSTETEEQPEARRAEDATEEEQARRADASVEDEQDARRQPEAAPEEDMPEARRQEQAGGEDEDAMALRRQEDEDEQSIQTRRPDEEPEAHAMRIIARREEIPVDATGQTAPPERQAELEPDAASVGMEFAGEQEPSDLQALHRAALPGQGASDTGLAAGAGAAETRAASMPAGQTPPALSLPDALFSDPRGAPGFAAQTRSLDQTRPNVVIDQLDVMIHEPAPARSQRPVRDPGRALRARYLRRL